MGVLHRSLHEYPMNPLQFEPDDGPAIERVLQSPLSSGGVLVSDLPHPSEELLDKVDIVQALYKEGLVMVLDDYPFPQQEDQEDEEGEPEPDLEEEGSKKVLQNTSVKKQKHKSKLAREGGEIAAGAGGDKLAKLGTNLPGDKPVKSSSSQPGKVEHKPPKNRPALASPAPGSLAPPGSRKIMENDDDCPF